MEELERAYGQFDDDRFDEAAVQYACGFIRHLSIERALSANTVRAYASDLRTYLDWAARAQVDPIGLDHRTFRRYLADLEAAGYERRTIARRLSAVRTFFNYLNLEGVLDSDPAAATSSPKIDKRLPRKTAASDIERLLSVCDMDDCIGLRDQAFLELLYACGGRISEISGLDVDDIDNASGQVRLFGKGSKERIVPLHRLALSTLRAYCDSSRPQLLTGVEVQALFLSTRGRRMSAEALRKVFKRRAAQAGLDASLHPHDMRHAFATDILEGGADLRSVQEMLGHASLSTTQVYTHLSVAHLKEVAKRTHPRS